jgi:GT2 family glycosyltransferase/LmbE family N-acetylglucosaminyl deacetylase
MESIITPTSAHPHVPGRVIAVLAPHPDDEVFGCGGTLAALVHAQIPVHVAILTDGQKWQDAPNCRREESCCAARCLGYGEPQFWGLTDGHLLDVPDLAQRILHWLQELEADTILAPSLWEMHRDHRACAQAAAQAVVLADRAVRLLFYEVGVPLAPNLLVDITPWQAPKARAMACFASQIARQPLHRQIQGLNRYRTYSLPRHVRAAEAFCLMDPATLPRLLQEASAHTVHLLRAEASAAQRDAAISDLTQTLTQRDAAISDLSQTLTQREAQLHQMLHSRSWQLTRPLRALAAVLRGERSLGSLAAALGRHAFHAAPVPQPWKTTAKVAAQNLRENVLQRLQSPAHAVLAQAQVDACRALWRQGGWEGLLSPQAPAHWPHLDISLVTYHSSRWLPGFFHSLLAQDYPLDRIHLLVVDNGSTDATWELLQEFAATHGHLLAGVRLERGPNHGFGRGHNQAMAMGSAPWVLVTNPDVELHAASLTTVVAHALADTPETAAWELRQMPYEHPKHYHPVTWETTWNSHACVLVRRAAVQSVGGYSPRLFLYGEDVELSVRLRASGFTLRYCPPATITHHAYATPGEVKPAQFLGSVTANALLRLRYGIFQDMAMVPLLLAANLLRAPFAGARGQLVRYLARHLLPHVPALLAERRRHGTRPIAPFRGMDYERARHGAFVPATPLTGDLPLVSVITRTMPGREFFLWQAGMTVLRQTYPHVEWVVVEDGGDAQRPLVESLARHTTRPVRYVPLPRVGRTEAGNRGLAEAQGALLLFLDDDDLLYADHLETLVRALHDHPEAAAAYSLAMEIPTTVHADGSIREQEYILHPGHLQPFDPEVLAHHNFIPIQALLFRRHLWEERGGFDPALDVLEDWNLWQRYAQGNHFHYLPKVTSLYRVPADPAERLRRQTRLDQAYESVRQATARTLASNPS